MKAIDYRTPWGRPSEHILAVKQEIVNQQMHMQRVKDAKSRGMINMQPPDCVTMPHLINRLKKKKLREDRQRDIATENYSLMHRLAGIMKEDRINLAQRFSHLSVEYRESVRGKKALKLQEDNLRLARALKSQKPVYSVAKMDRDEGKRQILLSTMSRSNRRRERVHAFSNVGRSPSASRKTNDTDETPDLMQDGIVFRPGSTTVKLKTARQMKLEVASRRSLYDGTQDGGSSTEDGVGTREGEAPGDGCRGLGSTGSIVDSNAVERIAYSTGDNIGSFKRMDVALEVNRTGGERRRLRGGRRSNTGGGRPNMIFTPSLVPVGMESVRVSPLSLGCVHPTNASCDGSPVATVESLRCRARDEKNETPPEASTNKG